MPSAVASDPRRPRPARRGAPRPTPDATRERILAAALAGFATHGYDGVATRDIAARARANQGLVTYYFGSKERLWKEVVARLFAELRAALVDDAAALADADLATRLRDVVRRFVRFSAARPELHRLMVQEGKSGGPRMRWLLDRHVRPVYAAATGLIEAAQAEGLAPRMPAFHLLYILIGAGTHLFVVAPECRRLAGRDPADPAVVEAHAEALLSLLVPAGARA
jgi:TetR/AcrR family transcriptional regulator